MFPRCQGMRTLELGSQGAMRAELNALVLAGAKTATAGRLEEYADEGEPVEQVGERMALVDDDNAWVGTVEITDVREVAFEDVDWGFAQAEGEGFTSLEHWRAGHLRYWARTGVAVVPATRLVLLRIVLVDGRTSEGMAD